MLEYKVEQFSVEQLDIGVAMEEWMNKMEEDGWNYHSVNIVKYSNYVTIIMTFTREKVI